MIRLRLSGIALGALLAFGSAARAEGPLQFDSSAPVAAAPAAPTVAPPKAGVAAPPGIAWLQSRPMTLFDLGMMELSQAATKATEGLFDVSGAVAEYRANVGKISITFYARTAYSEQNCTYVVRKLREQMFPKRDDPAQLQRELASYFVSYNPENDNQPDSVGAELLDGLSFVVFLPGGACELPMMSEKIIFLADPNYKPEVPPVSDTGKEPGVPDIAAAVGALLGGAATTASPPQPDGGATAPATTPAPAPPTTTPPAVPKAPVPPASAPRRERAP